MNNLAAMKFKFVAIKFLNIPNTDQHVQITIWYKNFKNFSTNNYENSSRNSSVRRREKLSMAVPEIFSINKNLSIVVVSLKVSCFIHCDFVWGNGDGWSQHKCFLISLYPPLKLFFLMKQIWINSFFFLPFPPPF